MKYESRVLWELGIWKAKILRPAGHLNHWANLLQQKINAKIPQKVHDVITRAIKEMVQVVLLGSQLTNSKAQTGMSLLHREALVKQLIKSYQKTGAAEGGITGYGGFLMSLADFPLLLSIKIKLLFSMAAYYGYDTRQYKERLFMLYIFQMAFSNRALRLETLQKIENWDTYAETLAPDLNEFDWQTFQQQYRDYIDLAKLAQMLPVVGAAVGAFTNYKLIQNLGKTAMMAYRLRYFNAQALLKQS